MSEVAKSSAVIRLIINADDYAYFGGVTRGILEGARQGVIRATGVMANSPFFDEHVSLLGSVEAVDAGVHLNVTQGRPLSRQMQSYLEKQGGKFPGKSAVALAVMAGKLPVQCVREEWQAQIQRCLDAGLELKFLNTHEHVHVLPVLYKLINELAEQYNVPFIRYPAAEWRYWGGIGAVIRNAILQGMNLFNRKPIRVDTPVFVGMGKSGKLDIEYLEKCIASLRQGQTYELMCHPGYLDPDEVDDPRLLAYHHWEQELDVLLGSRFRCLCEDAGVRLVGYRDLLMQT